MSLTYDFGAAVQSWQRVPLEADEAYHDTQDLLRMDGEDLKRIVVRNEANRYAIDGWRNWENGWREFFGLDHDMTARHVLDFGCGFGLEALQFARQGIMVSVADINPANVLLAERVLRLHGYQARQSILVGGMAPYFRWDEPFDTFYSSGVLHHTPHIRGILERAFSVASEARLLLYSDRRWKRHFGTLDGPTPREAAGAFDSVGAYADWYDAEKLGRVVEGFARLAAWKYIGSQDDFLGAILLKT